MINSFSLGHYIPGESFIHRVDPRAKMLCALLLIAAIMLIKTRGMFAGAAVLYGLLLVMTRVRPGYLLRMLRPVLYLILFTAIINMLFIPGETVYSLGILRITREGLAYSITFGLRLLFIIVTTSIITLTTSPTALTDGLERLLRPLKRVGVPAQELAMMMSLALRFIPTLAEELDKIRKAQLSRGADVMQGNLLHRARLAVSLLVPLFVSAFRRADELSLAMEARGYRVGEHRTRMRELRFGPRDALAVAIAVVILMIVIVLR
ncbi:MAG: energy-coupling factor transporter transmembrane component T family protein [Bacillota bacterium]